MAYKKFMQVYRMVLVDDKTWAVILGFFFEMINKIIASGVGDRNMVRSKDGGYKWQKE